MEFILRDIALRTVTLDDIAEVARTWNFGKGEISLEEAARAIDRMNDNHRQNSRHKIVHACFAVFEKKANRIIGWCGLDGRVNPGKVCLFYLIDEDFRRRGYGTECAKKMLEYGFVEMEIPRIDAACDKDNLASQKILDHIGMRRMDNMGDDYQDDGSIHFYLSAEDYTNLNRE